MNLENFVKLNREKKIVFTNGCFDILHKGHVKYLNEAKKLGDVLILGLNSDASVKRLKGNSRPINNELDRKYILENLRSVDFVQIFDEDTPYELIKNVLPDVLVKGGDWKVEDIVGHDVVQSKGGIVMGLCFEEGYSTTNIIEKSKQS
ncbi:MAG: D-glycero-beta-D-manno-heptose 1-phosphate adenylyltransferase [Halobacteriovoraceae bacterium]|nr:D-glycero-beta-D-manno-heptose 1-phosphate adenylyltransferase [Halobacteriovoraceae bacterium]